ncbi:Heterokaryon incompatibility [Cordyceps fumosorosea ARSEF 2679]|uniref:Heterokaryon incompatibility n=1 Tax=Cordyceps fumosorosea (strain ARSEF 2679) TaxID=1081104 RepID=A0A167ZLL1_CORFA|nr:Heterokaryon incompatibility [Cordyceps fumosorosea ARSEF 2679]OAA67661.1 Heterokaryon incompatibility [Cordyceps fumosorosea ARSEF 2679]
MIKFTKILPRRLQGRGGGENGSGKQKGLAGPRLESARDHHQLTPRKGIPTKKPTRTGASRIFAGTLLEEKSDGNKENGNGTAVLAGEHHGNGNGTSHVAADSAQQICEHCAAMAFPTLFGWTPGDARPWVPLAHTLKDESGCPYCTFFQAMIGHIPGAGTDEAQSPTVSEPTDASSDTGARQPAATSTFTPYFRIRHAFERLGISQKHELGRALLFEVTTKNKSLPRGYILRAVKDETGLDGYLESSREDGASSETGTQSSQPSSHQLPSELLRGRSVPALLNPALPRCWIDYCKENHADERCAVKVASPGKAPFKLIDVQSHKVVFIADLGTQDYEYVTLSYALGDSELAPFTEDAELPTTMPTLFQDSLSLTSSLGYRYLWINHYCLPSRENKLERRQQLDFLGEVFARSALTLIVAAGDGIAHGIPGVSVSRDQDQLSLQNEQGLFTTSLLRPDVEVAASRWANNAGTLQEGLLARRRLILTPSQAYFQCGALHCHESISIPLRLAPSFSFGRIFPLDGIGSADIRSLIGTYMTRELARPQDRLDAFRGLSRAYSIKDKDRVDTFMGLPLFDPDSFTGLKVVSETDRLTVAMSWMWSGRIVSSSQEANNDLEPCYLDKPAHFPSWTWLSWRIRQDQPISQSGHSFCIPQTNDQSVPVVADGLCAPPRTEISVGFADGLLVSWEIDGVAISRRAEPITFLRIKIFCFDIKVTKTQDEWQVTEPADIFDQATRDTILLLVRSSHTPADTDPSAVASIADGEFAVTAMLLTSRNWRPTGSRPDTKTPTAPAVTTSAEQPVTALLCAPKDWQPEQPLVRLGVVSFNSTEFKMEECKNEDEGQATLEGVASVSGEKRSLGTKLRELDLY